MQSLDSGGSELHWVERFSIGSVIEGKIEETKDIGVVVSFEKYHDVFGFITHYQCKFFTLYFGYLVDYCCLLAFCYRCNVILAVGGTIAETGSLVRAVVLDVASSERLVDLSLKPEFLDESRGESLKSKSHKKVKFYALYLGALNHFDCVVSCRYYFFLMYDVFMLLPLCCYIMVSETQKRNIQGLGSASNSKCNCGNCERELLGKYLTLLFMLIDWCYNSYTFLISYVSEFHYPCCRSFQCQNVTML